MAPRTTRRRYPLRFEVIQCHARVAFSATTVDNDGAMSTVRSIVQEHRKAAKAQRKKLQDPREARRFLIRAGILTKSGGQLAKRYR